jgi:hypothetical protein
MTRRAPAGLSPAAAIAAFAICLAGCGSSAGHGASARSGSPTASSSGSSSGSASASTSASSAPGRLTVTPVRGHPTSELRFTLQAPTPSGRHGQTQVSYALSESGPQGSGCVAEHSNPVAVTRAEQAVTVAVGPSQLRGRWCAGSYSARVDELVRPVCGPAQACPQFIRVAAVIGPVHFRITP